MSTSAGIIFGKDIAIYRHSDGYPECTGEDLVEFMYQCSLMKDSRLNNPSYLAAKYVVWLAHFFTKYSLWPARNLTKEEYENPQNYLNFLSVGIINAKDAKNMNFVYYINFFWLAASYF